MASELTLVPPNLAFDATIRGLDCSQKVFGRYVLRRILGRGGMGVVWLAHDERLDRDVALKFLPEEVYFDPGALDDLKRETRRCLDLTHPNIIRIYDFIKDEQAAAISMEYIDGQTLASLRVENGRRVFEVDEIKPWIAKVCQALHYAHEEVGVVHRDLKPANLMLTSRGQIKIADFGIAQSMAESMSRLTMRRGSSGTLAYMSPQQLGGDVPRATDDLYALGTTIYELLTTKPPFYSGDIPFQVRVSMPRPMAERRRELEIPGREIPAEWEDAIAACLAKLPAERPQTMMELSERLGLSPGPMPVVFNEAALAAVVDRPMVRAPAPPPPLPRKPFPTRLALQAAGACAVLALALGVLWSFVIAPLLAKPGALSFTSNPPGATVIVPGMPNRVTPAVFPSLRPGHYHVTVSSDGFDPAEQDVTIAPGAKMDLGTISLQRSLGSLSLATVPLHAHYALAGGANTGNFRKEGTTPDFLVKLPSGNYQLTVTAAGFPAYSGNVTIPPHDTKSEAADLTQLAIAGGASLAPARVIRGELPAASLDDKDKAELGELYNKAFEEYLNSGLLASAADQLGKLKGIGGDISGQQLRLNERRATIENDLAGKISTVLLAGKSATAEEKLKNLKDVLEPESLGRLTSEFQPQLGPYRENIDASVKAAQDLPPSEAYAQLKMLVRKYPDDLRVQLALAGVQTQMPPDHEFLTVQLAAFKEFSQQNKDFAAEPDLVRMESTFTDELTQLDALTSALSAVKNGPAKIRNQIDNLEARKETLANRRVGRPKGNPFTQTINFFGKAVTGHAVVDNAAYFETSQDKRDAIADVQTEIDTAKLSLAQPQGSIDMAQKNYNDFVARVPWGQDESTAPATDKAPTAPSIDATADAPPMPNP